MLKQLAQDRSLLKCPADGQAALVFSRLGKVSRNQYIFHGAATPAVDEHAGTSILNFDSCGGKIFTWL